MLLVVNALLIPVAATGPDVIEGGWMLVGDDGRIVSTGDGTPPATAGAEVLDVAGSFVAPGFVSAHSHLFTSGSPRTRCRPDALRLVRFDARLHRERES